MRADSFPSGSLTVYMKKTTLKSVFLTGLLVLVPLAITLWVLGLVIGTMD